MKREFYPMDMEPNMRIDKYLSGSCPGLGRFYIQKLLKSGQVLVNKKGVKASYVVLEGDHIELEVPAVVEPEVEVEAIDLDILYEDQDIILINKPGGVVVHPVTDHYNRTLVNDLMYHCKDQLSGINGVMRPGIVYRIDVNTTGILIACKNDMTHNSVAAQLKEYPITRRYQAIVHGVIKEEEGAIVVPIGRRKTERKRICINYSNGRSAITHYRVLQRFSQSTYVEYRLETGQTHQIRVRMASLHHPLLGGRVYGPAKCPTPGLTEQTLHAGIPGIIYSHTGGCTEFTAPLPGCFDKLFRTLR